MQRNSVTSAAEPLSTTVYSEVALQTFEMMEAFTLELFPLLFTGMKTLQQAQIASLVFARQMLGRTVTIADLAEELAQPRSTVQHAVDTLIDLGRLETTPDPTDGRRRLLRIPRAMASEAGALEELLVRFRLRWHDRLAAQLAQGSGPAGVPQAP